MIKADRYLAVLLIVMVASVFHTSVWAQDNIFQVAVSDARLADSYFEKENYVSALSLYKKIAAQQKLAPDQELNLAQCYVELKQFDEASASYEKIAGQRKLGARDQFAYAESLVSCGRYEQAAIQYEKYLELVPDDAIALKKLWRLSNIQYLYEDSLHVALSEVPVSTPYGEICAVPYKDRFVFLSNRKELNLVEKQDAKRNLPLYKMYYTQLVPDTVILGGSVFAAAQPFNRSMTPLHAGPFRFYANGTKMIFAATSSVADRKQRRNLELRFAEFVQGEWKVAGAFPYNDVSYSVSDPFITEDGTTLIFSSDKPGGFGGRDLYRSELMNGKWTFPVNLGEQINTRYDEVFPFLHRSGMLYFSSNGHPGLGGLDVFRTPIDHADEIQNLGYPLNTNADEFGIHLDSAGVHGLLSSNRKNGGFDDDLYEFDVDLQIYPVVINGILKIKEHSWSDSSELKVLADAQISVVDNLRNKTVFETTTDAHGNFSVTIPYFSRYMVRVVAGDHTNVISLDIPKHKTSITDHEMVVVKDVFK